MEGLFSKRYKEALKSNIIPKPKIYHHIRNRVYMLCKDFDKYEILGEVITGEVLNNCENSLKMAYGEEDLFFFGVDAYRELDIKKTNENYFLFCNSERFIDLIEAYYYHLYIEVKQSFQDRLNSIFIEEVVPWQMISGKMFMLDRGFCDALKKNSLKELEIEGLFGAYEEFKDSKSYLDSGKSDKAIQNANCAFESVLKSYLNADNGTTDDLLIKAKNKKLFEQVPDKIQMVIVKKVLQGLTALRNNIGGHGQGKDNINVPRPYGELGVNLAATYIKFIIDLKRLEKSTIEEKENKSGN